MKKLSIYMLALLSSMFVACSDDNYDPEVGPQSYAAESPVKMADVSVTNGVSAINIAELIDNVKETETPIFIGTTKVKEGAMPAHTILKAQVEVSNTADFAKSAVLDAASLEFTDSIRISPNDLENAYFNDITKNTATAKLYFRTILYTVTKGDAEARIGQPGVDFFSPGEVMLTPLNKVKIAPAYYIIGGPNDWDESAAKRSIKFEHSDADVYEDPIFTVTFDASAGDTWFAIADDEGCEGIAKKDWSQVYGIVGGVNDAPEGKIDHRGTLGADNSFKVAAGAKKIRVTLNMMECTYKVEAISFETSLYYIGSTDGWKKSEQQLLLTDEDKGIYTGYLYCSANGGAENQFKFQRVPGSWDKEINAKTFTGGVTGDFTTNSNGNLEATAGDGVYLVTLDITKLTLNAVKIQNMNLVGDFNGWKEGDNAQQMKWDAKNFCFVMTNAGVNDKGWKFTANNAWTINLGANDNVEPSKVISDLKDGGKNLGVAGKTVKLYPCRVGTNKIYATVE